MAAQTYIKIYETLNCTEKHNGRLSKRKGEFFLTLRIKVHFTNLIYNNDLRYVKYNKGRKNKGRVKARKIIQIKILKIEVNEIYYK